MKKKIVWVSSFLALFLAALAVLAVYILQDEPLDAAAEKALRYQPSPVPPAENAFVGIAGLEVPAERDFLQAGEENIRRANQNFQRFGMNVPTEELVRETQPLKFSGARYAHSCEREISENCLEDIRADAANIQGLLEANATLIARYRHIQSMPEFSNTVAGSMEFSLPYSGLMSLSRLLSAKAILDIQNGNLQEGLAFLEKDMNFYRGILASREISLIDMMIAIAQIRQHANLLVLLTEQENLRGQTDRMRALLTPLKTPKETFMNALWREHVFIIQGLFLLPDFKADELTSTVDFRNPEETRKGNVSEQLMVVFLLKRNMTMNLENEFRATEKALIDAATPAQLRDMQEDDWWKTEIRPRLCTIPEDYFFCRHFKNFMGEILAMIAHPNSIQYLLKIHDVDARLRLFRARLEFTQALKSSPEKETPEQILARLGPETFNPYTGQPFEWNPAEGTIGFMPGFIKDRKRVEIRLSPPTP
jgi:hypothetical protein